MPARAIDAPVYVMKAELFKALGHPVRIRTLELLRDGDRPVSALLEEIGIEASHLSQHLAVLRRAGVVDKSRQGNTVTYTLVDDSLATMLDAARAFLFGSHGRTSDALGDDGEAR
ncbi:metalloregulator ArsR/SmtB family transcription factor [Georgenia sp. H159]|uniref:ArsR/SmtB family transcription factor n=1 Tax=Georgenia sp. H159 TaxID=3076115 RepID=UPI002D794C6A|nr:metalloregulator ArsR/SmtB family transcription factor [Georgenia sp. H159]